MTFNCRYIETANCEEAISGFIELVSNAGWSVSSSENKLSNLSWSVLRSPLGRELLLQRGKKNNYWLINYSPKFGFVNGSAIVKPEAIDESKVLHDGFGSPLNLDNDTKKWCLGVSEESCFITVLSGNNNFMSMCLLIDDFKNIDDGLVFYMHARPKYLFYFNDGVCSKKIIDNWLDSKNYIFKDIKQPNGSTYESMLIVDKLLLPWNIPAPVKTEVALPDQQPIKKIKPTINNINYKMIGRLQSSAEYHSWVVSGVPDFKGSKAKIHGLTDIYIADKWKGK